MNFPRSNRLVNKAEYKSVFDRSDKIGQKFILALYKKNEKAHARVGIIVPKRVANRAHDRNQIKRIVRESFRANKENMKGFDIVVIARHQADSLNKLELRQGIEKLWQKLVIQSKKASL